MGEPRGKRYRRPPEAQSAPWHATSSDEEARALFQGRLALFAKISLLVGLSVLAFTLVMYAFYPHTRPRYVVAQNIWNVCALFTLVPMSKYYLWSTRCTSLAALQRIDVIFLTVFGVLFAVDAYLSFDKPANMYSTFIFSCFIVFARVLYVPSTARRTAIVSTAGMLPLIVAAAAVSLVYHEWMDTPPEALIGGTVIYAALAVTIATVGSSVIYGLRREVRQARQYGQYALGDKIGEGGMGAVYKATHAMLRRPTAIKLLLPALSGVEHLARFEREVQLTSQLTHPNTIAIFDYGRAPDGTFYYAMEYLPGLDLEKLVAVDGPQPAPRVIHILRQACGALAEAHGRGLVHRDIKPANLILTKRGEVPDFVKVVDFGLVKDFEKDSKSTTSAVAGTPSYISPEAVKSPREVGPAGDLYSLGAVAYFLLTGTVVFEADNVVEMCIHHVRSTPAPFATRTDNPVPADLEALVMSCLAKAPGERPASALELRDRLAALPSAALWNERDALKWWDEYERRAEEQPEVRSPHATTMLSPVTMTVDLQARDELAGRARRG